MNTLLLLLIDFIIKSSLFFLLFIFNSLVNNLYKASHSIKYPSRFLHQKYFLKL